ncbi:hypothetical protein K0U00_06660, partial [Paenibacillus sepulcri]|nr:hypothetical protein [Paenibacillus sepulcri]
VARIMGLSRQSVQQTADTLERDGHIMYHENPHHRRSKLMEISQRGREALAYVEQRHADWANEAGRSYTLENLQEAARLLLQVADRLEQNAAPSQNEEI